MVEDEGSFNLDEFINHLEQAEEDNEMYLSVYKVSKRYEGDNND